MLAAPLVALLVALPALLLAGCAGLPLGGPPAPAATPTARHALSLGVVDPRYASGRTPPATLLQAVSAADGATRWRCDERPVQLYSGSAVAGGVAYALAAHEAYAFDVPGCRVRWHTSIAGFSKTPPVLSGGTRFVSAGGCRDAREHIVAGDGLSALDAASGAIRWVLPNPPGGTWFAPVIQGGTVYARVGGPDAPLLALRAGDGKELWRTAGGPVSFGPVAATGTMVYVTLAAPGADPAANGGPALVGLRAGDGAPVWRYQPPGGVFGQPVVGDGQVYAQTGDGGLAALDAASGAVRWTQPGAGDRLFENGMAAGDGLLVTGADDKYVYAFEAASGGLRWRASVDPDGSLPRYGSPTNPILADGAVVVDVAFGGVRIDYFSSGSPELRAFDARDGKPRWSAEAEVGGSILLPFTAGPS